MGLFSFFLKNFSKILKFWPFSLPILWRAKKPHRTLTTEYTFVRYVTCIGETQAEVVEAPRPSNRKRATNFYTTRIRVALGGGDDRYKG